MWIHAEQRIRTAIARVFSIDLRALGAFRIGIAALLIHDLWTRIQAFDAHYTELGVLTRAEALAFFPQTTAWSLHLLSEDSRVQAALCALTGVSYLALLLGYRTRIASVASWALTVSMQSRNEVVLYGADHYFRVLLFWGMFLPLSARYSLDSRRRRLDLGESPRYLSPWSAALVLQVASVYAFTALLKSGVEWRAEGTALYYALNYEILTRPRGFALTAYPALIRLGTWATTATEFLAPVLLLQPTGSRAPRWLAMIVLLGLHTGIAIFLNLHLLPYLCVTALVVFLPIGRPPALDLSGVERVARTRPRRAILSGTACLALTLVAFSENLRSLGISTPAPAHRLAQWLRIDQDWGFYAPRPFRRDGWYVVPATLRDGSIIDLLQAPLERPVSYDKPTDLSRVSPNVHWMAYRILLLEGDQPDQVPSYARYLCASWNRAHSHQRQAESLVIEFMEEWTPDPGQSPRIQKRELHRHRCEPAS